MSGPLWRPSLRDAGFREIEKKRHGVTPSRSRGFRDSKGVGGRFPDVGPGFTDVGERFPDIGEDRPDARARPPDIGQSRTGVAERFPDVGGRRTDVGERLPDICGRPKADFQGCGDVRELEGVTP